MAVGGSEVENNNNNNDGNGNVVVVADNDNNIFQPDYIHNVPGIPINSYRLPAMSAANLALVKTGKFVNFDLLLPASFNQSPPGFSLQVDPALSLDGDHAISLLP